MIIGGGAGQNGALGDGPNKGMMEMGGGPQSALQNGKKILSTLNTDIAIDWKGFEAECKNIVKEISNRFIDLGLEDHESDYGADQL